MRRFKKLRKRKRILRLPAVFLVLGILFWSGLRLYNNLSLTSEESFNQSLRRALQNGESWLANNQEMILERKNIALLKMLQECNQMHETRSGAFIVSSFLKEPFRPRCWRALMDPEWPVDADELNKTIQQEYIDNKWILYAIASEKSEFTPEELGIFELNRWKKRQLTHQLWALIHLQERAPDAGSHHSLIDHLCRRIREDLWNDTAVEDIYIQKAAFVLRAEHPEMIKKRWIERIIQNQNPDGGWDDRWMYFFQSSRRPAWRPSKGSDPHATIQALWLLYQIQYKYADSFRITAAAEN